MIDSSYEQFLESKRLVVKPSGIPDPGPINEMLFPFQRDAVRWAARVGRAALWENCGLGKTFQMLEWARLVAEYTGGKVIILTPCAVAPQFEAEGKKLGVPCKRVWQEDQVEDRPIVVTNYERVHHFDLERYAGVVADESSIFKSWDGKTRRAMVERCKHVPFRLVGSATPAPNALDELAGQSDFLGLMTLPEMQATFFSKGRKTTQDRQLMGHARKRFWEWLASWAIYLRMPSDLGYCDEGFDLPPLEMHEHIVSLDTEIAQKVSADEKQLTLLTEEARGLRKQTTVRRETIAQRVALAADLVNSSDEPWIVWCALNDESSALARAIPSGVEVRGTDSIKEKEDRLFAFAQGKYRVLITKLKIGGLGMNFQHCANMAFVGLSNSWEELYQGKRRCWRFGQKNIVHCHMVATDADGAILANLERKERQAAEMAAEMISHMADLNRANLRASEKKTVGYIARTPMTIPPWLKTETGQ